MDGWMDGWLVSRRVGWLFDGLVGCMDGWLVGWLDGRSYNCLIEFMSNIC